MDRETVEAAGIAPENVHQLPNGTYVHRGMFQSFGPGANCTLDLCPIEWTVYQYRPNLPTNAVFIALYTVALAVHTYLGIRWRSWGFMSFMIVGCVYAMIGYAGRVVLWTNPWSFPWFMIQMICVTGCPVFFTAAIYVTLSRAIRFFTPEISRLPPRAFYWIFISADMTCLVIQAVGGALSSASSGASQAGIDVAMAGLILQVIVLVIFCGFFADYMIRYRKLRQRSSGAGVREIGTRQKLFFSGLASSIILILARCSYRVDELSQGYTDSDKVTNEPLFIGLEGVLVYAAVICLFVGHPGLGFKDADTKRGRHVDESVDGVGLTRIKPLGRDCLNVAHAEVET